VTPRIQPSPEMPGYPGFLIFRAARSRLSLRFAPRDNFS
jgi:hypothetical protein